MGLVALLLVAAFSLLRLMREPLGPPLELVVAPVEAPTANVSKAQGRAQNKTCGNKGVMDLLVLGLTSEEAPEQRGADAIRLVRVDFDKPAVGILALPPDLWVDTPNLVEYGAKEATLTQAFWLVQEGAQGSEQVRQRKATQALAQVLLDNYDFASKHYITIDQASLVEMVDSLGGVEVFIAKDITQVPPGWHTFEYGKQTLDGGQVLDYVRLLNVSEHPDHPELDRLARQNQVIWAACAAALNNWHKLPELSMDIRKLVISDLSVDQILDLNCMLEEVGEQAHMSELDQDMFSYDGEGHLTIEPDYVRGLIEDQVVE